MKLTANFTLEEMIGSDYATRMGRPVWPPDGKYAEQVLPNLTRVARDLLEPIRTLTRAAVLVSSGYRPAWLNEAIGGAPGSAHIEGRAADIRSGGKLTPPQLAAAIVAAGLPALDKVILEFGRWVHVQVARDGEAPRGEVFTAVRSAGKTVYIPGLA